MVDGRIPARRAISPILRSAPTKNPLDLKLASTCNVCRQCNKSRGRDMDRKLSRIVIASATFAVLVFVGYGANADDAGSPFHSAQALDAGPAQMHTEFSNDALDVVRVRLAPHE